MQVSEEILDQVCMILVAGKLPDLRNRKMFIANLTYIYHMIKASELMLFAASRKAELELKEYFLAHLKEEQGHEKWLARDLRTAGVEITSTPLPADVAPMVGAIYYHIFHRDPVALLGYMLVMEGNPLPLGAIKELEELHGKDLCKTLRYHAENDTEHAKELKFMVDSLPLERQKIVREVALSTAYYYGLGLWRIASKEVSNG